MTFPAVFATAFSMGKAPPCPHSCSAPLTNSRIHELANTLSERQSIRAETFVSIAARDRQRHGRIEYAVNILEQWIAMVEAQWIAIVEIQVEGLQLSHT